MTAAASPLRRLRAGFTLAEILIATTLGTIVLTGTMTAFLMIGRSGQLLYNYNNMSADARRGLDEFGQDVRMANNLTYNSASSVTLTVTDNYTTTSNKVTYAYGTVTVGSTTYTNCFYRRPGDTASTSAAEVLIRNVTSCTFTRYDVLGASVATDSATKRLELSVKVTARHNTVAAATDNILSATYVLRNK